MPRLRDEWPTGGLTFCETQECREEFNYICCRFIVITQPAELILHQITDVTLTARNRAARPAFPC